MHDLPQEIIDKILQSYDWTALETDGLVQPIIVSRDNVVLDGAHRVVAARALGKKIPAIRIDAETEYLDPNELETWFDWMVKCKS